MGWYGPRTKAPILTALLLLMLLPTVLGQSESSVSLNEGFNSLQLTRTSNALTISMEEGDTALLLWSCTCVTSQ